MCNWYIRGNGGREEKNVLFFLKFELIYSANPKDNKT